MHLIYLRRLSDGQDIEVFTKDALKVAEESTLQSLENMLHCLLEIIHPLIVAAFQIKKFLFNI